MNPKVINPYAELGVKHRESLDYIIANLPLNPTFDDLNAKLTDSFFVPDPNEPSPLDEAAGLIKTLLPHAYNGYVNGKQLAAAAGNGQYHENQAALINRMLTGINTVPLESIGEFLGGMEEEIVAGSLTYEEQVPLLIAANIGKNDHEYWTGQIGVPGTWAVYLNANTAINYLHAAGWVSASVQGALLAYGLVKPPQIQVIDILTATIASTGLVAGKVIFGWAEGV